MWSKFISLCTKLILIIVVSSLTACGLLIQDPPVDRFLDWLGIDREYFSKLPTCEQVRLYSDLAPYFYGVHSLEATPSAPVWMDDFLSNKGQEVAPCVVNEANERLSHSTDPRNKWRVRALDILLENLQVAYVSTGGKIGADFTFPEAQTYLSQVVCGTSSSFQPEATRAFYLIKFRRFPQDDFPPPSGAFTTQGNQKMKEILCK